MTNHNHSDMFLGVDSTDLLLEDDYFSSARNDAGLDNDLKVI